jgi:hypothetical protein
VARPAHLFCDAVSLRPQGPHWRRGEGRIIGPAAIFAVEQSLEGTSELTRPAQTAAAILIGASEHRPNGKPLLDGCFPVGGPGARAIQSAELVCPPGALSRASLRDPAGALNGFHGAKIVRCSSTV